MCDHHTKRKQLRVQRQVCYLRPSTPPQECWLLAGGMFCDGVQLSCNATAVVMYISIHAIPAGCTRCGSILYPTVIEAKASPPLMQEVNNVVFQHVHFRCYGHSEHSGYCLTSTSIVRLSVYLEGTKDVVKGLTEWCIDRHVEGSTA